MSDLYILNWKSSYDVTFFMCQSRSTIFPGILIFVIFRPRDMQEYVQYCIQMDSKLDLRPSNLQLMP
jgi:hypothetical protein